MATLIAEPGASNANSYETADEASLYYETRLFSDIWNNAEDPDAALMMATRVLDALAQPFKTLVPAQSGVAAYYRIRRQWTGSPASTTQRLAWPRLGMFDGNGNALDVAVESVSVASAAVITTQSAHRRATGDVAFLTGITGTTPNINGAHAVTVIDETSFSILVTTTVGGSGGYVTIIPQELKDALAEFAGQLVKADRTLDNDVITQGLSSVKAGSVALTFKDNIVPQVVPDAVYNLMPQSWLTDELYEPALSAEFDVVSCGSARHRYY